MAQESDLSKTADKGKGKAVDDEKKQDVDGKTPANGKKEEEQNGGFIGHFDRLEISAPGFC